MENIESKYAEFKKLPLPDGISGKEIQGADLDNLRSKSCSLVQQFIDYRGRLNRDDFESLKRINLQLKSVVKKLKGNEKTYFKALWKLTDSTEKYLEEFPHRVLSGIIEEIHKRWQKDFFKIREILNEWDPLGVADIVDDEYDELNFAVYSVLIGDGTIHDVLFTIKRHLTERMHMDASDEELETVAAELINAVGDNR